MHVSTEGHALPRLPLPSLTYAGPAATRDSIISQMGLPGHSARSLLLPLQVLPGRWTAPSHAGECQPALGLSTRNSFAQPGAGARRAEPAEFHAPRECARRHTPHCSRKMETEGEEGGRRRWGGGGRGGHSEDKFHQPSLSPLPVWTRPQSKQGSRCERSRPSALQPEPGLVASGQRTRTALPGP